MNGVNRELQFIRVTLNKLRVHDNYSLIETEVGYLFLVYKDVPFSF